MTKMARPTLRLVLCMLLCLNLVGIFPGPVVYASLDEAEAEAEAAVEDDNAGDVINDYTSPEPMEMSSVYFYENFDDLDEAGKKWIISSAPKEDQQGAKYDGLWEFQLPQRIIFANDRALVLKSKARLAAISSKLSRPFKFTNKPLLIQYEVTFQNGMDCGGAYIKLLSHSDKLDLNKFTNKSPYSIMFGPDKCGNDYKLHFIFRHKNPLTGEYEEKHAAKPSNRLEESYTDKKPHAYLLKLYPDNSFQVFVDGSLINSGSLLENMSPPVNPPAEISDENDTKPSTWDDREKIPDATSQKPEDWDEDLPAMIPDPKSMMPEGWLEDEEPMFPDTAASKPTDWDDSMDGEWEPPKINNPACANVPGCGEWTPAQIPNPEFKGKWKQPMISNPEYKGKWSPRMIPNPAYYEDKEPFKMTPIGAVGIEIWAMTDLLLFDNFIVTDDEKVLDNWNSRTYDLKRRILDKDSQSLYGKFMRKINYHVGVWTAYTVYISAPLLCYLGYLWILYQEEGVLIRTFNYTNAHPWLWAVYLVVIALPVVLILTFCCGSSQEKRDARAKKTDEYVKDDEPEATEQNEVPEDPEVNVSSRNTVSADKEDLELDAGAMGDGHVETSEEDSDFNEEEGSTESEDETEVQQPKAVQPKKRSQRAD